MVVLHGSLSHCRSDCGEAGAQAASSYVAFRVARPPPPSWVATSPSAAAATASLRNTLPPARCALWASRLPHALKGVNVPTLKEQGINVDIGNWRGVYGRPGITAEQRKALIDALSKTFEHKAWQDAMERTAGHPHGWLAMSSRTSWTRNLPACAPRWPSPERSQTSTVCAALRLFERAGAAPLCRIAGVRGKTMTQQHSIALQAAADPAGSRHRGACWGLAWGPAGQLGSWLRACGPNFCCGGFCRPCWCVWCVAHALTGGFRELEEARVTSGALEADSSGCPPGCCSTPCSSPPWLHFELRVVLRAVGAGFKALKVNWTCACRPGS